MNSLCRSALGVHTLSRNLKDEVAGWLTTEQLADVESRLQTFLDNADDPDAFHNLLNSLAEFSTSLSDEQRPLLDAYILRLKASADGMDDVAEATARADDQVRVLAEVVESAATGGGVGQTAEELGKLITQAVTGGDQRAGAEANEKALALVQKLNELRPIVQAAAGAQEDYARRLRETVTEQEGVSGKPTIKIAPRANGLRFIGEMGERLRAEIQAQTNQILLLVQYVEGQKAAGASAEERASNERLLADAKQRQFDLAQRIIAADAAYAAGVETLARISDDAANAANARAVAESKVGDATDQANDERAEAIRLEAEYASASSLAADEIIAKHFEEIDAIRLTAYERETAAARAAGLTRPGHRPDRGGAEARRRLQKDRRRDQGRRHGGIRGGRHTSRGSRQGLRRGASRHRSLSRAGRGAILTGQAADFAGQVATAAMGLLGIEIGAVDGWLKTAALSAGGLATALVEASGAFGTVLFVVQFAQRRRDRPGFQHLGRRLRRRRARANRATEA